MRFTRGRGRVSAYSASDVDFIIHRVARRFPIPGYVEHSFADDRSAYREIALTASRYLVPGSQILDFGAGPCDKTAVLQELGYRCSAYDDLEDDWHTQPGTRDKIMNFAKEVGIDFHLADGRSLPFPPESFDMLMMHSVLEHLHDSPRQLLIDLLQLVRPRGWLFITVPNAANARKRAALLIGRTNLPHFPYYFWNPGPWRGHVREYVKGDLSQLAAFLGLEVGELRSWHQMISKVPPKLRRLYRGVTYALPGLRDSWLLVARKPSQWEPREALEREAVDDIHRAVFGRLPAWRRDQRPHTDKHCYGPGE